MNGMSLVRLRERFSSENLLALNVLFQIYKLNQIIIVHRSVHKTSSNFIRYIVIFINKLKSACCIYEQKRHLYMILE